MTAGEALAVAVRFAHLVALAVGAGSLACLLLVVRPVVSAADLDGTALRLARWAVAAAAAALALDLLVRLAPASGLPLAEALRAGLLEPLLADTWYGRVSVARLLLAGLLGVLLAPPFTARWGARPRLASLTALLAAALLAAAPLSGHVIAAESAALRLWQATAGVLHVLAAGVWLGALPLLAVALRRIASADEAARLAGRFSAFGVATVSLLVATGVASAYAFVGSVSGLVGTPYGRLLLVKLTLFLPVLAIAAGNLLRERPRLAAARGGGGAAAVSRLRRRVVLEATLGAAVLLAAAALATLPPAAHVDPVWPFSFRFTWLILAQAPSLESRVLTGVYVALLGVSALVYAALFPRQRRGALVAGGIGLAVAWLAVWPLRDFLVIDAYPTTYVSPAVRYHVTSLANGLDLFAAHCAACHGASGRGDGPVARTLAVRPADLTASHAKDHTAGDLYWWITNGMRQAGGPTMPGFGQGLDDESRWDLVNTVRLLSDAAVARGLTPEPAAAPAIVAPTFVHPAFPDPLATLASVRGRVVLLVVPGPGSAGRVARLAVAAPRIEAAGGLVVVARPEDAPDVAAVYGRFRPPEAPSGPVEFLVDRQGYLRARWRPGEPGGWDDEDRLLALVRRLTTEPPAAAPAGAHVH